MNAMTMLNIRRFSVLSIFALTAATTLFTSEMLASEAAETSIDYRAQGEYEGRVRDFSGYTGRLGMQVIALGDENYDAIVYRGGLPANGWSRTTP